MSDFLQSSNPSLVGTNVKISFVTSIYKTENHIVEFVAEARKVAQKLAMEPEIVLVNDASPDEGLKTAIDVAGKDKSVIVVDLSRNFGQHKALWTGMEHASGDLVMMLDGEHGRTPVMG